MPPTTPSEGRLYGRATVPAAGAATAPDRARLAGPEGAPPTRGGPVYRGNRRGPRWGRIFLVLGAGLLALALIASGAAWAYYKTVANDIDRSDPFSAIKAGRPDKPVKGSLNILMLGSDSRDPDHKGTAGEWRTDTMIIAHIPASHDKVYLVSLPRDLYVHVPKSQSNPKLGNTKAKLNASYAWGGLPLTVQTIEGYTGLRMDHVVLIDFGGFKEVVDALGGVDMTIEQDVKSIHPPHRQFKKGPNHLDGAEALDYVRQRYQFPEGDFARMRHQQQFMKAVLDKAASSETLSNPKKLDGFLRATAKAITVDKDFSLVDMALQFRGIRSDKLVFLVSPHLGSKIIKGEDVIQPDDVKAKALYSAMKNDKTEEYLTQANQSASPKASKGG